MGLASSLGCKTRHPGRELSIRKDPKQNENRTSNLSQASERGAKGPFSPTTVCPLSLRARIAGAFQPSQTASACGRECTRCLEKGWRVLSTVGVGVLEIVDREVEHGLWLAEGYNEKFEVIGVPGIGSRMSIIAS